MASKAQRQSALLMVACSMLWSVGGVFIKLISWHPMAIAGCRSLLAAAVMVVYLRAASMKIRVDKYSVLSGLSICATMFSFVVSNKLTTAANAIVLEYTSPAFLLIFSAVLFRQRFHAADVVTVAAVLFGISLFFFDRLSGGRLAGNCLSIFSGIMVALTYIIGGRADTESRMSGILFAHLATAAVGVPALFLYPAQFTVPSFVGIFVLGIFQLGIPYVLYGLALKNCPPLACSLIGAIEPLLNPVWVYLFYGEAPGSFALFGGAVVIASVTLWCVWRDRFVAAHRREEGAS